MPIESWIRIWRAGIAISILGVGQFMICVLISVSLYPGGTMVDATSSGFSASGNYLSDLGREVSFSGQDNRLGSRFFNWSLTFLGFSMLPFCFLIPTQAPDRLVSLSIAAGLGGMSAVALIVMGICPIDLYPMFHMVGLFLWLACLFLATSIHSIAVLTSKEKGSLLALVSVAVAMISVSYVYHGTETAAAVWFNREIPLQAAFLQKLVVIASLIWVLTFSLKMLLTTDFSDFYDRDIQSETEAYLQDLEDNPRRA